MKKIAILGTTPSRGMAPLNDKSWEIWTIGPGGKNSHKWDRLFEIHTVWPEDFAEYLDELSVVKKPQIIHSIVPMKERIRDWARSHGKDEDWLKKKIKGRWTSNVVLDREKYFEKYRRMWFSSSISYCLAQAIEEGADEIGCWGIDLESGEEYISQFTGCAFLLNYAELAGIKIHYPPGCGLERDLNPYPDRYEMNFALTLEKKVKMLDQILGQQEPAYEAIRMELGRSEGALLTMRELKLPQEKLQEAEQRVIAMNQEVVKAAAALNNLRGERSAIQFLQRMYVWGVNDP